MKQLNYAALKEAGYKGFLQENAPEKVLQFGEGNFLRAFVDYWFDISNEKAGWNGKCCLVQPIPQGLTQLINAQEGLYTLYLRGTENGEKVDRKRVISSVSRCLNPYEEAGFAARSFNLGNDAIGDLARALQVEQYDLCALLGKMLYDGGTQYATGTGHYDHLALYTE